MSISGLALILFLTFHMSMNLVALFSEEAYNAVCEFLGANWYALVASMGLAVLFIVHIIYAFILTLQNRKARGNDRYDVVDKPKGVEWASQNMMALGVIIVLGIFLHLFNFWAKMQLAEIIGQHDLGIDGVTGPTDGAGLIRYTFSNPIFVVLYLILAGLTVVPPVSRLLELTAHHRLQQPHLVRASALHLQHLYDDHRPRLRCRRDLLLHPSPLRGLLVVLLTTVHPTSKLSIPLRLCLR